MLFVVNPREVAEGILLIVWVLALAFWVWAKAPAKRKEDEF
jgi:hypothetical protein